MTIKNIGKVDTLVIELSLPYLTKDNYGIYKVVIGITKLSLIIS